MSKLFIKDKSTGRTYSFADDKKGYNAAFNQLKMLNDVGHKVDLSINNTGRRLQEMDDSRSTFLGRLFF